MTALRYQTGGDVGHPLPHFEVLEKYLALKVSAECDSTTGRDDPKRLFLVRFCDGKN